MYDSQITESSDGDKGGTAKLGGKIRHTLRSRSGSGSRSRSRSRSSSTGSACMPINDDCMDVESSDSESNDSDTSDIDLSVGYEVGTENQRHQKSDLVSSEKWTDLKSVYFTCPVTGDKYPLSVIRQVYIT